ncbi:pyridoxal phosphate-dependent aminotransferase [Exilibacterium tricleocarpae]|uniref:Aminotransferase n=1 Tax=Exilibacterium tricleocarpae TaxID=2591008 RepID=A0A545TLV0_9GAMM|nr:pyridoxal phosphate-dependent aminotransferase [Exilibacterium tricleocarpae]TQV78210.1 pyridoxal phosphate-dependent aminotransferase [Exilibacterium tricleocarpae]
MTTTTSLAGVDAPPHPFAISAQAKRLHLDSASAWQVHERAQALKQQGEDVVLLSIGDPDFRTPEPIIDNAVSHMRVGRTHYSPALGELNLRRAVADQETRTSPHPCSAAEVAVFPGGTAAIFGVMSCLLDPGDDIVIPDPLYVGYSPIMQALGVNIVAVPTAPERDFEPQFDAIVAAITPRTRVVFINTPGNPTGAIIGKSTLTRLAAYCYEQGLWLVCDEVYSMFTFEKPHVSLRAAAARLDNIVMIDGLSKSHAMSGWRMGWAVAPPALIAHLEKFMTMSLFGSPQFLQDAAAFALSNDEYYVQEMKREYRKRRDLVCDLLEQVPGISPHRPQSGMFVMLDVSKVLEDDQAFADQLLDEQRVSVIPGSAFGTSTRGHVRLSLVQPGHVLKQGCERIGEFVSRR